MSAARSRRGAPPTPARRNPSGAHLLTDQIAAEVVTAARLHYQDLVLDLGAGIGALTVPLARTGARVIAIERDARMARRLDARLLAYPNVRVVNGDVLAAPLPGRPYRVVANIPFGITTALLRRLVDSPLTIAHLIVEAGAGRRFASERPGRREVIAWQLRFGFEVVRRVAAHHFRPAPAVNAVVLRLSRHRRPPPDVDRLLAGAYRAPSAPVGRIVGRAAARRAGVDPRWPVTEVTAAQWRSLAGIG